MEEEGGAAREEGVTGRVATLDRIEVKVFLRMMDSCLVTYAIYSPGSSVGRSARRKEGGALGLSLNKAGGAPCSFVSGGRRFSGRRSCSAPGGTRTSTR
jgi:hypothetical protein